MTKRAGIGIVGIEFTLPYAKYYNISLYKSSSCLDKIALVLKRNVLGEVNARSVLNTTQSRVSYHIVKDPNTLCLVR